MSNNLKHLLVDCAGDPALLAEVESLLAREPTPDSIVRSGALLPRPAREHAADRQPHRRDAVAGGCGSRSLTRDGIVRIARDVRSNRADG